MRKSNFVFFILKRSEPTNLKKKVKNSIIFFRNSSRTFLKSRNIRILKPLLKKKNYTLNFFNCKFLTYKVKKKQFKKGKKKPLLRFSNFNFVRLFQSLLNSNPKWFTALQTKNFLLRKLKRVSFIKKSHFSIISKVIKIWYQLNFYSNIEYFFNISYKNPRYKRLKFQKSKKRFKFFYFFMKAKHISSWVRFFYKSFVERLLFYNFRLRFFWYKKKILLFFLRYVFRFKKNYLASLNFSLKKKTVFKIENRLDLSLVRFGFFKTLNFSRLAVTRGLILVNFKKINNTNYFLKKNDLVFISLNNYKIFEKILNEKHFFSEINQKFFIFRKRNVRFLKKKYMNSLFLFFKKNILIFKKCLKSFKLTISQGNPFVSKFFFLVLFFYDFLRKIDEYKRLNCNFFNLKSINLLIHSHF